MYEEILVGQKAFFLSGKTKDYHYRIKQIEKLENVINENQEEIYKAFEKDLRKSRMEVYETEIGFLLEEIKYIKKNLKVWMKKKHVKNPLFLWGSQSYVIHEPYGSVLIIGPFNYPFLLSLSPLLGAICAGNTVILKPSELTPHVSAVISKILRQTFPEDYISVIEGGVKETDDLLANRFDYIFFTGSPKVAKIIMKSASEHLTPLTLELGGKSPAILTKSASLKDSVRKIIWGKFLNTGATCIAPDYLLLEESLKEPFIEEAKKTLIEFYGISPFESPDYGRLVNSNHIDRLSSLLNLTKGKIEMGGEIKGEDKYIAPTLVSGVSWDDALMQEEIFGPILPIILYNEDHFEEQVIQEIQKREKPLALYLFTHNKVLEEKVLNEISFGGGTINDTIIHLSNLNLPFGGVGNSGMGSYHGHYSFRIFSHAKSIVKKSSRIKLDSLYPPYTEKKEKFMRKFL